MRQPDDASGTVLATTREPLDVEIPAPMGRILLEARTIDHRTVSAVDGSVSEAEAHEHALVTVLRSGQDRSPAGRALLVESWCSSDGRPSIFGEPEGERISCFIDGMPHDGYRYHSSSDPWLRRAAADWQWPFVVGAWQWTIVLPDVPMTLVGAIVLGDLRISARDLPIPRDLRSVPLDAYWAGRSAMIGPASPRS